jgi:two-component system sensor histidine kinase UhpB
LSASVSGEAQLPKWIGAPSTRLRRVLRLALVIAVAQAVFWGLFSAPWGPRAAMRTIDRIETTRAELAELQAPTPAAADAASHQPIDLPHTDCCDPAYLSLKTAFTLDAVPDEGLGLVAFQQVDNFIIRVNGSVLHQIGAMEFGRQTFHGQRPYLLHIPSGLLRTGENEISYITVRDGFPYTDLVAPLMGPYAQVRDATALRFWQISDYRLLGGWLTFILGLFALIMVFRSHDRRFATWLMILCWSWTAFAVYGLFFDLPFGGIGRMIAFNAINTAVAASLLCFIDAWTRRPAPWGQTSVEIAWLSFNAMAVISLTTLPPPLNFDLVSSGWAWFSLGAGLLVVARFIWHFATVDEDRHFEAALLSICAVCLALDGVGERFGLLAGGYLMDAAPLLLLAFVAAFVQRNFTLFQSAVGLNAFLEAKLRVRERELAAAHARERDLASLQARSEERRRMLRDMHDGVGGATGRTASVGSARGGGQYATGRRPAGRDG